MCSLHVFTQLRSTLLQWPVYTDEEENLINPTMGKFATMAVFTWGAIAARTITFRRLKHKSTEFLN